MLLSSYVDGEVSNAEAQEVDRHLDGCEECRIELEELQSTVSLLSQLPQFELPRSFVFAEAPRSVRQQARFAWTLRVATPVAALLLFALVLGDALGLVSQSQAVQQAMSIENAQQSQSSAMPVERAIPESSVQKNLAPAPFAAAPAPPMAPAAAAPMAPESASPAAAPMAAPAQASAPAVASAPMAPEASAPVAAQAMAAPMAPEAATEMPVATADEVPASAARAVPEPIIEGTPSLLPLATPQALPTPMIAQAFAAPAAPALAPMAAAASEVEKATDGTDDLIKIEPVESDRNTSSGVGGALPEAEQAFDISKSTVREAEIQPPPQDSVNYSTGGESETIPMNTASTETVTILTPSSENAPALALRADPGASAQDTSQLTSNASEGVSLPLQELEIALAAIAFVLVVVLLWDARRNRRWPFAG